MTPEQVNVLLTSASRIDPLILNTDETFVVWEPQLNTVDFNQAEQIVMDYYGNREPHERNAITPGHIRRQARARIQRNASKRAAIDRAETQAGDYKRNTNAWRSRNPQEWDRLVQQGRDDHRERLRQQGIPLKSWQELETLHGPQDRVLS